MARPAVLLVWLTAAWLTALVSTANVNVTVFYVNDLRYDIFPVSAPDTVCVDDSAEPATCFGGLSRLTALYEGSYTSSVDPALWLNAGNLLGGPNFNLLKFPDAARVLNFLQFNASALGPELFRYGLGPATAFLESAKNSPMLSSNWEQSADVKNSSLFALGEHCHAAVIGFVNKQEADTMKVFGVSVEDEKTAIEREVAAIKAANADKKILYIALGSASIEGAKTIAAIPDVDLVIFSGGNFSATEKPEERAFLESVVVDNKTTWVSSVNRNFDKLDSRFLIGQLDLQLTEDCKIDSKPSTPLLEYLSTVRAVDAELTDFLRIEAGKVADMSKVVARSKVNILPVPDACILGECSLGGLVADALIAKLNSLDTAQSWNDSTKLAVVPGGVIKNVENITGDITTQALYDFFVQDEYVYTISLTGSQFKKMLEIAVSPFKDSKTSMPDFLQVSGSIRVEFNKKKVTSLWAVSEGSELLTLSPVNLKDDKTLYKVAVPSSLLFQQESYTFLRDVGKPVLSDVSMVDALLGSVTRAPTDNFLSLPVTGGRLVWKEKNPEPVDCTTSCGEAVVVTLVVVASIILSGWIVWKIVLPKYRNRSGSNALLLP